MNEIDMINKQPIKHIIMEKTIFRTVLFLLYFTCLPLYSQGLLWQKEDIVQNEQDLISAFIKYEKRPSREKLKTQFLQLFKERTSFHQSVIEDIKKESNDKKDWLNWINRIESLQYIYETVSPVLASNNIPKKELGFVLDSVRNAAVKKLYIKGTKALDNSSMSHHLATAYRSLSAVNQLQPGYEKTEELLGVLKLQANKKAYLKPLEMGNQGNYFMVSLGDSSELDEYVRNHIVSDIDKTAIGFKIDENSISASDYEISINWKSINFIEGGKIKNTYERQEKERDKIIKATVTYEIQKQGISSSFEVIIKDRESGRMINSKLINAADFMDYITVTYTGDRDALTREDMDYINNSGFNDLGSFKRNMVYQLYDKNLHQPICTFINATLGW